MKLIVISNPTNFNNEHSLLCSLFDKGLENFHLRKPNFTSDEMEAYINQIPPHHYNKIILHAHYDLVDKYQLKGKHKANSTIIEEQFSLTKNSFENFISTSFHSTDELLNCDYNYEYVFLSPIFNSISKENYNSKFNTSELKSFLDNYKKKFEIIALGGINDQTISQAINLGFDGVAVLGAVWNSLNPLDQFLNLNKIFIELQIKTMEGYA